MWSVRQVSEATSKQLAELDSEMSCEQARSNQSSKRTTPILARCNDIRASRQGRQHAGKLTRQSQDKDPGLKGEQGNIVEASQ